MAHGLFVFFFLCHVPLARASEVHEEASCESPAMDEQSEAGQAMIQIQAQPKMVEALRIGTHETELTQNESREYAGQPAVDVPGEPCPLPAGAVWCQVRLKNIQPYWMAVYANDDWVSVNICTKGFWEEDDLSAFGPPGHMMDIGGNIGYITFAFAAAGWTVTTFEPMAPNLAMQDATRCKNPSLAEKITLNRHGLGTKEEECKMIAPIDNVGDGFTRCTDDASTAITLDMNKFKEIGQFAVKRLDEVLIEQKVTGVDVVKVDVEGYEYQVFAGAPTFLAQYHPRLIKSEVNHNIMVGRSGPAYIDMFAAAGYKFFKDSRCQVPFPAGATVEGDVYMCK